MIFWLACTTESPTESVEMSPLRLLNRASLDLRGVRPSEAELAAVQADPDQAEALIDDFVNDERFFERLVQLYHEVYLTETEGMDLRSDALTMDDPRQFYWEVGQEPLRIIAEVARQDLPYTEIVLADWTMATDQMAEYFPLELEAGTEHWRRARYTDGRPAAGVAATNGLWWRFTSTETNANRRRANALTTVLVCENLLDRPIGFDQDVNLVDEEALRDAIRTNPSCISCHVSLDPVAANLFGFYWSNFTSPTQGLAYHPGRERYWYERLDGVAPAWFGTPTGGLGGLGRQVAADPRFPDCAAEQAFEGLLRREVQLGDMAEVSGVRDEFVSRGLTLRALYSAVVDSPAYRTSDVDTELGVPLKFMPPDILNTSVADLTGFVWQRGEMPVLLSDRYGLRSLGGGVGGITVTKPATASSATTVLVQVALADEASAYVVSTEQSLAVADRRLFRETDFVESAESAVSGQAAALHLRVLGEPPSAAEEEALVALWQELYAVEGSVPLAWQGVLEALLRDPSYVLY